MVAGSPRRLTRVLTVAVLGPVEVCRDGTRLAVPSGRTTEVLVRLALDAGVVVRTGRLIEDLWGAEAVGTAKNTLQSKVSQLRRALGPPSAVISGNGGYLLDLPPDGVDALEVVDLAARSAEARRSQDAPTSLAIATEALARFRGEVLIDAGEGSWLAAHRVRLEEVRLGLLEDQLAARVELGTGGDVIGELESLVGQHPLREGLWSSLITALYRSGRQADALAAYGRVREVLVEELGIEPGPQLRDLEVQVLQQSPALALRDPPAPTTPVPSTDVPPSVPQGGNLPALTSTLVGRETDLDTVTARLREQRLVTLVGPAGVGKTRLAIEVARGIDVPGGVWLVRLDGADATSSITRLVIEALQVSGGESMLVERLAGAETVLVLDNCEHVIGEVADLTARLLDATTRLHVLATSQLPLGLDGEAVHLLEPLRIADSIALFAGRASEIRTRFVLDADTTSVVEEVCRSLDGLPLAIELAAARVKSLSVQEIARRLDDRFALLQDPTSRRPERRRALAGAIAWSYDLLFPDDQRGLWALACFSGGAPLAAAEHVLGALGVPEASAVDVVGRLADRSLVSVDVAGDGTVRYRLLDSIRAFALDRLVESGLDGDAGAAHAAWYASAADRCGALVRGPAQAGCVALARAERVDVDAALAWCAEHDPGLGVRIANGFGWTWVVLGDGVAGAARVRDALVAADGIVDARARVTGLLLAGWLEASAGDVEQAETDLLEAEDAAEPLDDERLRADIDRHLAFLRIQQGRPQDVVDRAEASLLVYRSLGLDWEVAASLLLAAFGALMLGDVARASESASRAVELLQPLHDSWGLVHGEAMLGAIASADRRFDEAARLLTRAVEESERLAFVGQAALHLTTLGRVEHLAGRQGPAGATLERAIAAADRSGDRRIGATARIDLARVHRTTGRDPEARVLLEEVADWYLMAGGGDGALLARALLLAVSVADGHDEVAALEAVLEEARRGQMAEVEVFTLDALARGEAQRGDAVRAAELLAAADERVTAGLGLVEEVDRVDATAARRLLA